MKVDIPQVIKDQIKEEFPHVAPPEHCGVLMGKKVHDQIVVSDLIVVPNRDNKPNSNFLVLRKDVQNKLRTKAYRDIYTLDDVVGVFHTHPSGGGADPSWQDVHSLPPGQIGLLYHPSTRTLTRYTNEDGFVQKERL